MTEIYSIPIIARGRIIEPGEDARALLPHLDRLTLVEISFPVFTDGRGFSSARVLRELSHVLNERCRARFVGRDLVELLDDAAEVAEVDHLLQAGRLQHSGPQIGGVGRRDHPDLDVAQGVAQTPQGTPDWSGLMAATWVSLLPVLILLLVTGRRLVNSIQFSGIK